MVLAERDVDEPLSLRVVDDEPGGNDPWLSWIVVVVADEFDAAVVPLGLTEPVGFVVLCRPDDPHAAATSTKLITHTVRFTAIFSRTQTGFESRPGSSDASTSAIGNTARHFGPQCAILNR